MANLSPEDTLKRQIEIEMEIINDGLKYNLANTSSAFTYVKSEWPRDDVPVPEASEVKARYDINFHKTYIADLLVHNEDYERLSNEWLAITDEVERCGVSLSFVPGLLQCGVHISGSGYKIHQAINLLQMKILNTKKKQYCGVILDSNKKAHAINGAHIIG